MLIKEAFLLSFATASSEAAYPKILDALDRFGVKRKISSFVMPMGYSFNLDGSMMYCTFAMLFIAQAYDIDLSIGTQITMLLILMLTSKGMAGVPRASLVVIAATLNQFNIPEAGLLLILGVDTFLDMGRSATNAVGNSIATRGRREVGRRAAPGARGRGEREDARHERRADAAAGVTAQAAERGVCHPGERRPILRPSSTATCGSGLRRAGVLLLRAIASPALAQADAAPTLLTGTLAKVQRDRRGRRSAIATRRSRSRICPRAASRSATRSTCASQVVDAIGEAVGRPSRSSWEPVTSDIAHRAP